ncbi:unnamed protein product, partial [Iphiclides podalirius]
MEISQMLELTVTSEIYEEYDYKTNIKPSKIGIIRIEHSSKTEIALVGLQVWRGAFLLGDLLIHLGLKGELEGKTILELGAGTGITSFVGAIYAKKVICTDIDLGGILDLIKLNAKYNGKLMKSQFKVMPLDFTDTRWSQQLLQEIRNVDIVVAADVIYDDDVTAAFISTVQKIMNTNPPKVLYIVMEKRYVFTIEHLDAVAPCYETFLALLERAKTDDAHSNWTVEQLPLDFPKYFTYERVKELVLWRVSSSVV